MNKTIWLKPLLIEVNVYKIFTSQDKHRCMKLSSRTLFFLRRLLSQKGARVSPKYISFRNLFCPFNDGLNRCASDEVNEDNCLNEVQGVQRWMSLWSDSVSTRRNVRAYIKSRAIFYFTGPGNKLETAMRKLQVWQIAACNRYFKILAWLLIRLWRDIRYCGVQLVLGPWLIAMKCTGKIIGEYDSY